MVEDNGYAEATASSYSVGGTQVGRGQGFGLPSVEVDGSDFFAVYETAGEAIARARSGGGTASSIRGCCSNTWRLVQAST